MNARLFRSLAAASLVGGLVLAVAAPRVGAAASDTDDSISPANTSTTATSTNFSAMGTIDGVAISVNCTSSTFTGTTPASGLTINIAPPTFSGCMDSTGHSDTIATSGTWKVTFKDASNDETKHEPNTDHIILTIPKAGATFTSTFLPACTVIVAPNGPANVSSTYNDKGTAQATNVSVPTGNNGGCTTSATSTLSATYKFNPAIHDVS